jgi:hypothetical protein
MTRVDLRIKVTAVTAILLSVASSGCGDAPVTLRSTAGTRLFSVAHDGRYRVAYVLHKCQGANIVVRSTTVGGLSAPLPHEILIVSATRPEQQGATEANLYYGSWQVDDSNGTPSVCTWVVTISRSSS